VLGVGAALGSVMAQAKKTGFPLASSNTMCLIMRSTTAGENSTQAQMNPNMLKTMRAVRPKQTAHPSSVKAKRSRVLHPRPPSFLGMKAVGMCSSIALR